MAYLQWNVTGTQAKDLFATSGTNYVVATATAANMPTPTDEDNRGDSTKLTGVIQNILIANNREGTSTVNLYLERWDGSGDGGTLMYILNTVKMPAGTSLTIDTPIQFNRKTDSLIAYLENSSDDITIYITYKLSKAV